LATGKVNEISNNAVSINNRPFFRVKCQLDQHCLKLKNGHIGELKKGMTLTGRFKVADRTLFQLLFDKADDWLNPRKKPA
jgi:HlyD family secretion protein